jgi:phage terminase large subunit-like protein
MIKLPDHVQRAILCGYTPNLRDWRKLPSDKLTRGERNCRFIEHYLVVPEGQLVGKPVKLSIFQEIFILSVYDNPEITDTAILSIARKNAKTGTIAFLVLVHTVGPEAMQNSRIISGAMSREQAAEVYNLASKCVMLSPKIRDLVRIVPSSKKLVGLPMNVEYQAISAEGKTAHGKSPIVAILDEMGQIRGPQSDFVDAITTAQGAYDTPLLIYISTQSATDADLFSLLIDDAKTNKHSKTICHVYAADPKAELLDEDQWQAANPALGVFRSLEDMRKQAEKASRMPSFESTFRNLNLNQRVSIVNPFVSRSVWETCGREVSSMDGFTVYCGLDLSMRTDLTAFVVIGQDSEGDWHVWPFFWTPEVGLRDRSHRDRQPYDLWVQQGWLMTTPGATVDYGFIVQSMSDILSGCEVASIGYDRWRIDLLKREAENAGIEFPFAEFGQGFKDMSPALDNLESVLLNGSLRHGMHPVLTMCAANAVTVKDPAGNRKLDKSKATGRIDGMVALAMAVGVAFKGIEPEDDLTDFLANPVRVY